MKYSKSNTVRKKKIFSRTCAEWKNMKFWSGNDLCRLDWILSILILAGLFVTCVYGDIRLTGNRSFLMYHHFTDFYEASYEQSGGYWANYLPSTFIAHAPLLRGILVDERTLLGIVAIQKRRGLGLLLYRLSACADQLIKGWHIAPP